MSQRDQGNTLVMSSFGSNPYKDNKATFWKKNTKNVPGSIRPVYGAQHPPRQEKPMSSQPSTPTKKDARGKPRDSFQDFQDNTSDAWDDGDDDLILMANIKMSLKDVHSTAMEVINKHSQQRAQNSESEDRNGEVSPPRFAAQGDSQLQTHSAQSTPTHAASGSHHPNHASGPGVGVRLNNWPGPRSQPLKFGHMPVLDREASKAEKFKAMLDSPTSLELDELRKLSWSGTPRQYRPMAWKILSGYLPPSYERRDLTLQRKRQEYFNFIDQYYDTRHQELHQDTFRQIHIDIPRMSPLIPLFQQKVVQEMFERILFIWAIRHPASGYVQGINDLVTPYFIVFLAEHIDEDQELDHCDVSCLSQEHLGTIEADSFWCFSKLMDSIQDNYTFAQPGIQVKVNALKDLVSRIDNDLHKHLASQNVEYLQFSFRWMNNLLMRELPLRCTIRLWDTYLSEVEFAHFHLYVCAAMLTTFSQDLLREKDFHGLMLMLQNLPTDHWQNEEIDLLLAEAYRLKYMFADAPNHLVSKK